MRLLASITMSFVPGLSTRYGCAAASNRALLVADTSIAIHRLTQSASLLPWLSDARLLHSAPLRHPVDVLLPLPARPCAQREDPAGSSDRSVWPITPRALYRLSRRKDCTASMLSSSRRRATKKR